MRLQKTVSVAKGDPPGARALAARRGRARPGRPSLSGSESRQLRFMSSTRLSKDKGVTEVRQAGFLGSHRTTRGSLCAGPPSGLCRRGWSQHQGRVRLPRGLHTLPETSHCQRNAPTGPHTAVSSVSTADRVALPVLSQCPRPPSPLQSLRRLLSRLPPVASTTQTGCT